MKKYKFTILKHTLNNGSVYYLCNVKIIYPLVWTKSGISLFLTNYSKYSKTIDEEGYSWYHIESKIESRENVLKAIDLYITNQEKTYGEALASIETEIIWR
jgi:hypothetical protein